MISAFRRRGLWRPYSTTSLLLSSEITRVSCIPSLHLAGVCLMAHSQVPISFLRLGLRPFSVCVSAVESVIDGDVLAQDAVARATMRSGKKTLAEAEASRTGSCVLGSSIRIFFFLVRPLAIASLRQRP